MDPNERARRLVALATNTGASSEEARSAAMAACRLIAKHKLLDAATDPTEGGAGRRPGRGGAPAHDASRNRRARHEDINYRAHGLGVCAFCATPYGPKDEVMTYPSGSVDHWHCAKRRAAGVKPEARGAT
ncbi:MAG: hypothetical protein ABSC94_05595 [Polyangiaceae bacterium]|jgi:hypothetical protein